MKLIPTRFCSMGNKEMDVAFLTRRIMGKVTA